MARAADIEEAGRLRSNSDFSLQNYFYSLSGTKPRFLGFAELTTL
jgi:hypothetical protein